MTIMTAIPCCFQTSLHGSSIIPSFRNYNALPIFLKAGLLSYTQNASYTIIKADATSFTLIKDGQRKLPRRDVVSRPNFATLKRPMSPISVYQPQLTSVLSIGFRITGAGLTILLYGAGITVAIIPIDMASVCQFVHEQIPAWLHLTGKVTIAAPFTYHFANGIRHLIWDTGRALTLKGVYYSGYAVLIATVISTALLVMR